MDMDMDMDRDEDFDIDAEKDKSSKILELSNRTRWFSSVSEVGSAKVVKKRTKSAEKLNLARYELNTD